LTEDKTIELTERPHGTRPWNSRSRKRKEERSWDMLRNMEIFPRVPHHGENPPVNQPRRKTPHN